MSLILFINGQQVDLEPKAVIAQTKQVNDLNSLDNRQTNFTNKFKLPMTAKNVKIMQHLSLPGNNSDIPYQKNVCSLFSETGECFVYNGWALVSSSSDGYDVNIYDGNIDLYKAIENKNLSELGLTDINHVKNVASVLGSWNADLNYRYILADYNGNTGNTGAGQINIDYLVPSVKVSYLWNKIFQMYGAGGLGVGYDGSVFYTPAFKNLYMTFPKGFTAVDSEQTIFESNDYSYLSTGMANQKKQFAKFNSTTVNTLESTFQQIHLKVPETGTYRIEASGAIHARKYDSIGPGFNVDSTVFVGKNAEAGGDVPVFLMLANQMEHGTPFENSQVFELQAHDSVCIIIHCNTIYNFNASQGYIFEPETTLDVKLIKFNEQVDFEQALTDFSIKDFLNEVVHRFALTMYKDKYTKVYEFLTLQEVLQTDDVLDWSDKFNRKVNEDYLYQSYAQRNWLRYNYNDKESTHHDWYIDVPNENLADSKNVIASKIYAPERLLTQYMGVNSNVYKLWDKEIEEDPAEPIKYKPLDKRYYFLRAEPASGLINIYSDELEESSAAVNYYRESYWKLPFKDIVNDYYMPIQQILQKVVIMDIELFLNATDIVNFDFKKLYYIEQLSSYFLMNKISNYVPGKPVKCEMIRVLYSPLPQAGNSSITITNVQQNNGAFGQEFIIFTWSVDYQVGDTIIQYSASGIDNWIDATAAVSSPYVVYINTLAPGLYFFRIADVTYNIYSPSEQITVI